MRQRSGSTSPEQAKIHPLARGFAGQFFVAGELSRRGLVAVITNGNCPNTDILASDVDAKQFIHIQVKTFRPGDKTCGVGIKAEVDYGPRFYWVLAGIPVPGSSADFVYFVIPSPVMAEQVQQELRCWADTPGKMGQQRKQDNTFRAVYLPPALGLTNWDLTEYKNRWDLICDVIIRPTESS
jgi:hypothetical protein